MRSVLLMFSAVASLALFAAPHGAWAFPAKCVLQVDGKTYLNGRCNVDAEDDGSFSVGTGPSQGAGAASPYFAYVNILADDRTSAEAWWNETPGSTHAHSSLGTVKLADDKSCWTNERTKICWSRLK